jgi:predicted S18 family serine protease
VRTSGLLNFYCVEFKKLNLKVMSVPRIKFREQVSIVEDDDDSSIEDEKIVGTRNDIDKRDTTVGSRRSHSFHHIQDVSALRERRKNLEYRIKNHCRSLRSHSRSSSERQIDYPSESDDASSDQMKSSTTYVHVSTIGEINSSKNLSEQSLDKSKNRKESLKSNDGKITSRTVCTTIGLSAPWKPK